MPAIKHYGVVVTVVYTFDVDDAIDSLDVPERAVKTVKAMTLEQAESVSVSVERSIPGGRLDARDILRQAQSERYMDEAARISGR